MPKTKINDDFKNKETLSFKKLDELKNWEHWYTEIEKEQIDSKAARNFKPVCVVDSTSQHLSLVRKYKLFARSLEKQTDEIIIVNIFEEKSCGITRTIFFATPQLEKALKDANYKPLVNYLNKEIEYNETKNILYSSNLFAIDDENVSLILSSDANKSFNHTYNAEEARKINQEKEYKETLAWFNSVGVLLEIKEHLENKQKNNKNNEYKATTKLTEEDRKEIMRMSEEDRKENSKISKPQQKKATKQPPQKTTSQTTKRIETTEKRKERYQREKENKQQKLAEMTQEEIEKYNAQKKEKNKAYYEKNKQKIKNAYLEKKEAFKQLSKEEQEQAKAKEHERRKREYQAKRKRDQEKLSQMTEEEIAKQKAEKAEKQHEYYLKRKERAKEKQQNTLNM